MYAEFKERIKLGQNEASTMESKGVPSVRGSFAVRKANASDGEGILACLAAAFAPYRSQYSPGGFEDTVLTGESLQRRLADMSLFVAISGERIVGTIACKASGDEGHLRGMAVLPQWQGTGVASALLRAAEAELRGNQCKRVTLDTTEPLKRATRFYLKHGYAASGRVSDFFGMPLYEYTKVV